MTPSPFSFGRLIGERDNITQLSHSVRAVSRDVV